MGHPLRMILAIVVFAAYAAVVAAQAVVDLRTESPRRGLLYEIKSGGRTAYLFGTLHVGKPEFYPLDAPTNAALAESSSIYLEVNLTDFAAIQSALQMTTYPGPTTLADALPPALMEKVRAKLLESSLPRATTLKMKPWMLAHTLLLLEAKRRGYDPELASELYLLKYAALANKEIRGLETLADQFAIFDQLSPTKQQAFLEQTLAEIDDPGFEPRLKRLTDAWARADAGALEQAMRAERARASIYADTLLPRLLDQRNRAMAEKIESIVRTGPPSFFAVGAFHLVGREGIVELLRLRGLTVRQL